MNKVYSTIAMLICTVSLFGQIITSEEVKERAEQKSEQRVDQKVDEGIDKGLDAIEGLLFGKRKKKDKGAQETDQNQQIGSAPSGSTSSSAPMGGLMSQNPANVRELYSFDAYTVVKMEITNKRGKIDELIFRYYFPEDGAYIGTELQSATGTKDVPQSITIMDLTNQQMVMLMDNPDQPMGMIMRLDAAAIETMDEILEDETEQDMQLIKTGRTKKILGYNCDEYTMNSEDGVKGTYWVTDETDLNIGGALAAMGMQNKQNGKQKQNMNLPDDYPLGALMELEYTQENGEKMTMTTIEVNTNFKRDYNTNGYTFMNMNFGR